jgi:hypothetical protein
MTAARISKAIHPGVLSAALLLVTCDGSEGAYGDDRNVSCVSAGIGSAGLNSDGAGAPEAPLNHPTGIELGGKGNLYIADTYNECIRFVVLT